MIVITFSDRPPPPKKTHIIFWGFGKTWSRLVRKSKNKKGSGLSYRTLSFFTILHIEEISCVRNSSFTPLWILFIPTHSDQLDMKMTVKIL